MKRHEPPVSAARREMHEELGLSIEDWVALGELFTTAYRRRDTVHCFQAELQAPELTIDCGEIATTGWFSRHELPEELGRFVTPILARVQEAETR
jgi:8-oxo-dGTP pyrophosphatase MutT (NUDIX family)